MITRAELLTLHRLLINMLKSSYLEKEGSVKYTEADIKKQDS